MNYDTHTTAVVADVQSKLARFLVSQGLEDITIWRNLINKGDQITLHDIAMLCSAADCMVRFEVMDR